MKRADFMAGLKEHMLIGTVSKKKRRWCFRDLDCWFDFKTTHRGSRIKSVVVHGYELNSLIKSLKRAPQNNPLWYILHVRDCVPVPPAQFLGFLGKVSRGELDR